MRKIIVLAGHQNITLAGDITEIKPQLIGSGWLNHQGGYRKDGATMAEIKSIIHMYGEPNSVQERRERNIRIRTDIDGKVIVEGETSAIKLKLKAKGGIWCPRPCHWSFQEITTEAAATLINEMTMDGSCDTKITELTWNTPISPIHSGEKHVPKDLPKLP